MGRLLRGSRFFGVSNYGRKSSIAELAGCPGSGVMPTRLVALRLLKTFALHRIISTGYNGDQHARTGYSCCSFVGTNPARLSICRNPLSPDAPRCSPAMLPSRSITT